MRGGKAAPRVQVGRDGPVPPAHHVQRRPAGPGPGLERPHGGSAGGRQPAELRADLPLGVHHQGAADRVVRVEQRGRRRQHPGRRLAGAGLAQDEDVPAQLPPVHAAVRRERRPPLRDAADRRRRTLRPNLGGARVDDRVQQAELPRQRRRNRRVKGEQPVVQAPQFAALRIPQAAPDAPPKARQNLLRPKAGRHGGARQHDGDAPVGVVHGRGRLGDRRRRGAPRPQPPLHQAAHEPVVRRLQHALQRAGRLRRHLVHAGRPHGVETQQRAPGRLPPVAQRHQNRGGARRRGQRPRDELHAAGAEPVQRVKEVPQRRHRTPVGRDLQLHPVVEALVAQPADARHQLNRQLVRDGGHHLDHRAAPPVLRLQHPPFSLLAQTARFAAADASRLDRGREGRATRTAAHGAESLARPRRRKPPQRPRRLLAGRLPEPAGRPARREDFLTLVRKRGSAKHLGKLFSRLLSPTKSMGCGRKWGRNRSF